MGFRKFDDVSSQFNNLSMLLYGGYRVGKTELVLKLLDGDEILYYFSVDKGIRTLQFRPDEQRARVLVSTETTYNNLLDDVNDVNNRVLQHTGVKNDGWRRWIVVDTLTHMQSNFLAEGRKVQLSGSGGPRIKTEKQRDYVVQTDWGINQAWMTEIMQTLIRIPCNVIFIALEDRDKNSGLPGPMLQGATLGRSCGACDIIARLVRDGDSDRRLLQTSRGQGIEGGVRGWELGDVEPADLALIRDKFLHREVSGK